MTVGVGAAQSYIEGVFGGPTEEQEGEITASVSAQRMVGNDPEALALTIINLGGEDVYIMFDDEVSTSRGILLVSAGGSVSMTVRDDQTLPTREWWVVSGSGTSDVFWVRTRRYAYTYVNPVEL